jgi:NTP pyrophosphatase (non-canonical NTP hydrolase)
MDIRAYQRKSRRTMAPNQDALAISNYAMGLAGESGEVVDLLKKWVHHGHTLDRDKLVKELGDVMWYVAAIATCCDDISLTEVCQKNIDKLMARYPEGFSRERSINREA